MKKLLTDLMEENHLEVTTILVRLMNSNGINKRRQMMKAMFLSLILVGSVALTLPTTGEIEETYSASTPCEESSKRLMDIPAGVDCEFMKWNLTLTRRKATQEPSGYRLQISYGMTKPNTNGFAGTPYEIQRMGKWTAEGGLKAVDGPSTYKLYSDDTKKPLLFRRLSDRLLHLEDIDGRLMVGNGGWSYTLNRTDVSSKAVMGSGISSSSVVSGTDGRPPTVEKFVGRSPCREAAQLIEIPASPACLKIKWSFTFHRDPVTGAPTTYKVRHTLIRDVVEKEGTWSIIKGTRTDRNAIIYHVDADKPRGSLLLQMVDENILVILDRNMSPLVGNSDYSFTLNRTPVESIKEPLVLKARE